MGGGTSGDPGASPVRARLKQRTRRFPRHLISGTRESTIAVPTNGSAPPNGNGALEVALPFAGTLQAQYQTS